MKNVNIKQTRKTYDFLIRLRLFVVIGVGVFFANSYVMVLFTKAIYQGPLKAGCVPFMNCHACPFSVFSCPIGMLQHFAAVRKLPLLLIGFLGIIGITVGRAACGWLCPFGLLQDLMYRIRSVKLAIHPALYKLKYASLFGLVLLLPYLTEIHWFSRICPWGTLIAGIPWVLWNPVDPVFDAHVIEPGSAGWFFVIKVMILVSFLLLFIVTKRPFCRTTCPMGALYSMFNRFSLMQVEFHANGCKDGCTHCRDICPVDSHASDSLRTSECIRCLKCTSCKNMNLRWKL